MTDELWETQEELQAARRVAANKTSKSSSQSPKKGPLAKIYKKYDSKWKYYDGFLHFSHLESHLKRVFGVKLVSSFDHRRASLKPPVEIQGSCLTSEKLKPKLLHWHRIVFSSLR